MEKKYIIKKYKKFTIFDLEQVVNEESNKGWELVSLDVQEDTAIIVYFNMNLAKI